MSQNWGPHYIIPSEVLKTYSGAVLLRETLDDALLQKELEELDVSGPVLKISNPWYYRGKGTTTWIKIGESGDKSQNFPVRWDTAQLKNGRYEVMGLMHVFVKKNGTEVAIARENVVEVLVEN
jgi:small-conductance mechanosensitive channel